MGLLVPASLLARAEEVINWPTPVHIRQELLPERAVQRLSPARSATKAFRRTRSRLPVQTRAWPRPPGPRVPDAPGRGARILSGQAVQRADRPAPASSSGAISA